MSELLCSIHSKEKYRQLLEEGFEQCRHEGGGDPHARLEFLSDHIFNFTTYDGELAELFAIRALEVCSAISSKKTFEYIKDQEQYRWYLAMVNMPFFADRLEWGTSIRGAWWGWYPRKTTEYSSCGLWQDDEQLHETIEFTEPQWIEFIAAILEFATGT